MSPARVTGKVRQANCVLRVYALGFGLTVAGMAATPQIEELITPPRPGKTTGTVATSVGLEDRIPGTLPHCAGSNWALVGCLGLAVTSFFATAAGIETNPT
jgi:allophanate hydrolase subunit 1